VGVVPRKIIAMRPAVHRENLGTPVAVVGFGVGRFGRGCIRRRRIRRWITVPIRRRWRHRDRIHDVEILQVPDRGVRSAWSIRENALSLDHALPHLPRRKLRPGSGSDFRGGCRNCGCFAPRGLGPVRLSCDCSGGRRSGRPRSLRGVAGGGRIRRRDARARGERAGGDPANPAMSARCSVHASILRRSMRQRERCTPRVARRALHTARGPRSAVPARIK